MSGIPLLSSTGTMSFLMGFGVISTTTTKNKGCDFENAGKYKFSTTEINGNYILSLQECPRGVFRTTLRSLTRQRKPVLQ
jgi:hypothetical protein